MADQRCHLPDLPFSLVQVIAPEATNEFIKAQLQGSTKVSDRRAGKGVEAEEGTQERITPIPHGTLSAVWPLGIWLRPIVIASIIDCLTTYIFHAGLTARTRTPRTPLGDSECNLIAPFLGTSLCAYS